ncbi:hypothetical protein AB0442_33620 [Kitasatospora sp. NPDC085895]|uniref:hypothetical protein n=1 Tax=Kitasatospora sp. NPDC085895 TaxID=3155057 RepID=UPI00344DD72E
MGAVDDAAQFEEVGAGPEVVGEQQAEVGEAAAPVEFGAQFGQPVDAVADEPAGEGEAVAREEAEEPGAAVRGDGQVGVGAGGEVRSAGGPFGEQGGFDGGEGGEVGEVLLGELSGGRADEAADRPQVVHQAGAAAGGHDPVRDAAALGERVGVLGPVQLGLGEDADGGECAAAVGASSAGAEAGAGEVGEEFLLALGQAAGEDQDERVRVAGVAERVRPHLVGRTA